MSNQTTRTLVIQSHRLPLPQPWLGHCIDSVAAWAELRGYDYEFCGDALFDLLAPELREKTIRQPVIAADLARLVALDHALNQRGYDCAVWCDADFLIFAPERLQLPADSYAFGREVWVQRNAAGHGRKAISVHSKVHNAWMMFRRGNPMLPFYRHAAERLVRAHADKPMVPQFVGPKFLSAIHNMIQCPVCEPAAMLAPDVAADLVLGAGPCLDRFTARSTIRPAAVNLCASLVDPARQDIARTIDLVLNQDWPWPT